MAPRVEPVDLPLRSFENVKEFETFLNDEHTKAPGIHLKIAKKASGIPSITAAQAVEVALCYGWIDGQANSYDEKWYLVRYTPRRKKSIWSKKNVDTVERLFDEGRMRAAGVAAVDAAKADGRWDRAYAGPATICVPDDFALAVSASPPAAAFFDSLNSTERYSILWRIETASPQGRAKRVEALVQLLAIGKLPGNRDKDRKTQKTKNLKAGRPVQETGKAKAALATSTSDGRPVAAVVRRAGLRSGSKA